jgi:hypothetical protein
LPVAAEMRGFSRPRSLRTVHALLVIVVIAAQATALSHEFEHVLHRHEGPCALHVAADHLMMVAAPEPAPALAPEPVARLLSPLQVVLLPLPARPSDARAPPLPA